MTDRIVSPIDQMIAWELTPEERQTLRTLASANEGANGAEAASLLSRFLLVEVVNKALASFSLDELLLRIVELAADTLDAERGTLFLHDADRDELFSRIAQGEAMSEIRIPAGAGIAGTAFTTGSPQIIDDAYAAAGFDPEIDQITGYRTRSILCVPFRSRGGAVMGVIELLNKRHGRFTAADGRLLELITAQAAITLEQAHQLERAQAERDAQAALAASRELRLKDAMGRYMTGEVLDRLISDDADFLRGAIQHCTILFADIRDFTTLAEGQSPQATVDMLNEYFSEMVKVIFAHGGILDKFIGDAILAVFSGRAHAEDAADAALGMLATLRPLNRRRADLGARPLAIGIGMASGEVLAGSIGSPQRMDYTVIGDAVNLASRLEAANKFYRTAILLCAETRRRLKRGRRLRAVDLLRVKGKERFTEIFELLDHHTDESFPNLAAATAHFAAGLSRYRKRDWGAALNAFAKAIELAPQDGPAWVYTDRCLRYRDAPPPEGWDGVWDMAEK